MSITIFLHFLMLLMVAVITTAIILVGLYAKRHRFEPLFRTIFGYTLMCLWIVYNIYYFLPNNFQIDVSLPLHICDILSLIASYTLIKQKKYTNALLYFWGLLFASQAIITPVGNQDPSTMRFWLFWLLHIGIIAAAIYNLIVLHYHPSFKDLLTALSSIILYAILILPLNIITGWNYGYIGNISPDTFTVISILGPWPLRLFWMFVIISAFFFLMYLPWHFSQHNHEIRRQ